MDYQCCLWITDRQVWQARKLISWHRISSSTWRKVFCRKISFWTTFLDWWGLCVMQTLHFVGQCFIVHHYNQASNCCSCFLSRSVLYANAYLHLPSVLWRCWLGGRKGIRPVKNWVVGCWHGYLSGARCRLAYGPANATATYCPFLR